MTNESRTPTHCPHCGVQTATDSLGKFRRTTKIKHLGDDDFVTFLQTWFEFHCAECDNRTAMLESEEPLTG